MLGNVALTTKKPFSLINLFLPNVICLSISISTHIYSMHNIIYNVVYIVTLNTFLFQNVTKCQLKEEIFKIKMFLYFGFLQIFYGLTMKLKVWKLQVSCADKIKECYKVKKNCWKHSF